MATDFRQLEEFRDKIQALADDKCSQFCDECTKELTGRLLAKVIKRTPVGTKPTRAKKGESEGSYEDDEGNIKYRVSKDRYNEYWAGYVGGDLRHGWTGGQKVRNVKAYAQGLPVNVMSNTHRIDIINQVEYATYVEYGHRQTPGRFVPALGKRLKQSWVKGQFMMTDSVKELDAQAGTIVQRKLDKFLKDEGLG